MQSDKSPIPVPWSNRIRYLLSQQLQGWLFALSVVAVLVLWLGQKRSVIVAGQVEMIQVVVPASQDGVLELTEQPLARFDRVLQGVTPVASIDVTGALLKMNSLTAEREQLQAEFESERQRLRKEQMQWQWQSDQELRQLEQQSLDRLRASMAKRGRVDELTSDVNDLDQRKRSLVIRSRENATTLRKSEIVIESLTKDRSRVDRLIQLRMSPPSQLIELDQNLELQQASLQSAKELERLMTRHAETLERQLNTANQRLSDATNQLADSVAADPKESTATIADSNVFDAVAMLEPYAQAIAVQDAKIRILANQIASNQIVAPATGTITEVHHPPGTFVRSGDPILTIASDQRRWIVAYLDEQDHVAIEPDAEVQIRIVGPQTFVTTSSISDLGNHFESVPPQLRRSINVAQWGVPIKVPVPAGVQVTPGQMVELVIH